MEVSLEDITSDLPERRFWRASDLTIRELIGSVKTSAFLGTNPTGELITSGFSASGNSHSVGKGPHVGLQAMKPQLSA